MENKENFDRLAIPEKLSSAKRVYGPKSEFISIESARKRGASIGNVQSQQLPKYKPRNPFIGNELCQNIMMTMKSNGKDHLVDTINAVFGENKEDLHKRKEYPSRSFHAIKDISFE